MTQSSASLGPPTAAERGRWTPAELVANPELFAIMVRHAYRAVRVQFLLRIVLLVFINTIGAWANRPQPKTNIPNLYLAGDYVRNAIDLACMEGAVSAALDAAAQILKDHGESGPLPVVQVPPEWSRTLLVLARILLIPVVAVARIIAWLEEKLSPHQPYASKVRRQATPGLHNDPRPPRKL